MFKSIDTAVKRFIKARTAQRYFVVMSHTIDQQLLRATGRDQHDDLVQSYGLEVRALVQTRGLKARSLTVRLTQSKVSATVVVRLPDDETAMNLLDSLYKGVCPDTHIHIHRAEVFVGTAALVTQ